MLMIFKSLVFITGTLAVSSYGRHRPLPSSFFEISARPGTSAYSESGNGPSFVQTGSTSGTAMKATDDAIADLRLSVNKYNEKLAEDSRYTKDLISHMRANDERNYREFMDFRNKYVTPASASFLENKASLLENKAQHSIYSTAKALEKFMDPAAAEAFDFIAGDIDDQKRELQKSAIDSFAKSTRVNEARSDESQLSFVQRHRKSHSHEEHHKRTNLDEIAAALAENEKDRVAAQKAFVQAEKRIVELPDVLARERRASLRT